MPKFKPATPDLQALNAAAENAAQTFVASIIARTPVRPLLTAPDMTNPVFAGLYRDVRDAYLTHFENEDIRAQVAEQITPLKARRDRLIEQLHEAREEVTRLQAERKTALSNGEKPSTETIGTIIALTGDQEALDALIAEVTGEIEDFQMPQMNNHLAGISDRLQRAQKGLARQIFQYYADDIERELFSVWRGVVDNSPVPVIHLSRPMRIVAEGRPFNVAWDVLNG